MFFVALSSKKAMILIWFVKYMLLRYFCPIKIDLF